MVAKRTLLSQLKTIGFRRSIFGRKEINELQKLLFTGESIVQCVRGNYEGGAGLLVLTDQRIILIDKQPFYLNLEEIKYESITSVSFRAKFLYAELHISAGIQKLHFRSLYDARLKYAAEMIDEYSSETNELANQAEDVMRNLYFAPKWRVNQSAMLPRRGRISKFNGVMRQT